MLNYGQHYKETPWQGCIGPSRLLKKHVKINIVYWVFMVPTTKLTSSIYQHLKPFYMPVKVMVPKESLCSLTFTTKLCMFILFDPHSFPPPRRLHGSRRLSCFYKLILNNYI